MKREPVSSSSLVSVGYDTNRHILEVEFIHGAVYQYFDVPLSAYQALLNADSRGRYFNANIRENYDYLQIR
jgi:hypothetical protein